MSSRMLWRDIAAVGSVGLRTRRLRAALSALGIAIGIASMVAVLGISQSSKTNLLDRLHPPRPQPPSGAPPARLPGRATHPRPAPPGESFFGARARLPSSAPAAIRGMATVETAAA